MINLTVVGILYANIAGTILIFIVYVNIPLQTFLFAIINYCFL